MSLSSIVDVQISRQTTAPTQAGFGTALFVTDTVPGGFTERVRTYNEASELIDDGFISTDTAYKFALAYFSQDVKPTEIKIGRIDVGDADIAASMTAIRNEDDDFYAIGYHSHVKADIIAMAAIAESLSKIYGYSSDDADILTSATDDVASTLQDSAYDRTWGLYSADEANYPEAAWFGLNLPEDPGSITWMFKTLSGVAVDTLTATQKTNAKGKNINVYTTVGGVNMTEEGVMASGEYIDVMRGTDWIQVRIQENVFASLTNLPKIPYTDRGAAVIENDIRPVLSEATRKDVLASDPAFTVTVPLVATVSQANRANRLLPDIAFAGTLAGAIHKTEIRGVVTV